MKCIIIFKSLLFLFILVFITCVSNKNIPIKANNIVLLSTEFKDSFEKQVNNENNSSSINI